MSSYSYFQRIELVYNYAVSIIKNETIKTPLKLRPTVSKNKAACKRLHLNLKIHTIISIFALCCFFLQLQKTISNHQSALHLYSIFLGKRKVVWEIVCIMATNPQIKYSNDHEPLSQMINSVMQSKVNDNPLFLPIYIASGPQAAFSYSDGAAGRGNHSTQQDTSYFTNPEGSGIQICLRQHRFHSLPAIKLNMQVW